MNTYLILIILCLLVLLKHKSSVYEGINFNSTCMKPFINKSNIKINPYYKTLAKNGNTIYYGRQFNTQYGKKLSTNKYKTKKLLTEHNIPNARYFIWDFNKGDDANINKIALLGMKFPLVIKPITGSHGNNVYVGIKNIDDLKQKINHLQKLTKHSIIVEEQVEGDTFRILVFNDTIVDIVKRIPPHVYGDGRSTLSELIDKYLSINKQNGNHYVKNINYNYILQQGYNNDDIVRKNQRVYLTQVLNLHNGAGIEVIDINDVHPDNIELFKKINKISMLKLNGIDFISKDLRIPYYKHGIVVEINSSPGVEGHVKYNPNSIYKILNLLNF